MCNIRRYFLLSIIILVPLLVHMPAHAAAGEWVWDHEYTMHSGEDFDPDLSETGISKNSRSGLEQFVSDTSVITLNGRTLHAEYVEKQTICYYTAGYEGKNVTWRITVLPSVKYFDIYLDGSLFTANMFLIDKSAVGTSFDMTAKAIPETAEAVCEWSSNNNKVLSVTQDGHFTVNGAGQCTVTLKADTGYTMKLKCQIGTHKHPYYIEVDKANQVVRIYTKDAHGLYSVLERRMICSTGKSHQNLPDGLYNIPGPRKAWMGTVLPGIYVQYGTQLWGQIYFHSIPYTKCYDGSSMETEEYLGLGTNISGGCIRLLCADSRWIYDNIEAGTYLLCVNNVRKPGEYDAVILPELNGTWDPTDDNTDNPYYDMFYDSAVSRD